MFSIILVLLAFSMAILFSVTQLSPNGRISGVPAAPFRLLLVLITLPSVVFFVLLFSLAEVFRTLFMEDWDSTKDCIRECWGEISELPGAIVNAIRGVEW